ncbi:transcriptional regulator NrdR [Paenibacillus larvae]|uniref:Transcriptional repressor NrdR n=4 Tax=Paenibacillus larvae TaxID=1464 RepID=V9WDD6_9BACL|nr:transcriptional regulator NrdR [Paenibacillus larvae]AHD07132.1 transcriptional repressor NrdR [Paenibacillus larvae subsp. larvae DSM 25430]AQR78121.1 transcriptional regulator NrdR [Paenibacillus larvae subsp. larvae]AQT85853.1 transcriptional regulator NrdR [Paenibacillus larvae subsp. pulvifaciens]AQZ45910.1 transcriptional regulator NrdR [Paenibacillus larvae subsp. pulvifaciens]ARF69169.1 transcriptional regulator NrdR [Paenibacillus larvae subsp. pulvifaciens]
MKCPFCDHLGTKVLDSRAANDNKSIRRRRECEKCMRRFTTFEMVEETPLMVVKKDGSREEFNRDKILRGLVRACEKRPVSVDQLEQIVTEVEMRVRNMAKPEVDSREIGELVMEQLYPVDEVAYIRFASVYRQFKDISMFMKELNELLGRGNETDI